MPLLFYTTKVPVVRTVAEVSRMLGGAGARAVQTRYQDGQPSGVAFVLGGPHGDHWYTLPVDISGVHRVLLAQHNNGQLGSGQKARVLCTPEHAARVAWRIAREWLAVQLALVEAQMATVDQIMLPYLHVDKDASGHEITLYDRYREYDAARALSMGDDHG